MEKGTLYGIGVGPGDKELITVKAVRKINECGVIAVPNTGSDTAAYNAAKDYIQDKEVIKLEIPMKKGSLEIQKAYENAANTICSYLDKNIDVAFLTLGDPSIYSTFSPINHLVSQKGYKTSVIPGITSFCAAAAAFGKPLCEGKQSLYIIPSDENINNDLELSGTKVFMKIGNYYDSLKEALNKNELVENTLVAERCGMEGEKLYKGSIECDSYFSIAIVKSNTDV